MINVPEINNRRKGCFFGLAVGDALGTPIEMKRPGTFEPITGFRDRDPKSIKMDNRRSLAGEWTDDTSMALALADALSTNDPGHFHVKQLKNYIEWYRNGKYTVHNKCFGMGGLTRRALEAYEKDGNPIANNAAEAITNGSIMRLAPIPIKYYDRPYQSLWALAKASSETTHSGVVCKDACAYMASILAGLICGGTKEYVLNPGFSGIPSYLCPEIRLIANGSYKTDPVSGAFLATGTLEAALWAFWSSNSFEETVLKAVNLGGDADTVGAVAGQFAGAFYGFNAIPKRFVYGLAKRRMIQKYYYKLVQSGNRS